MAVDKWTGYESYEEGVLIVQREITLSADCADETLPEIFRGGYIYQGEMSGSLDDAWTFTIKSVLGNPLYTITTSAATSSDATNISQPAGYYYIGEDEVATYTLANLGSGTATIKITGVKK